MRQTAFCYTVSAQIVLTKAEVDHLMWLAGRHYDGHCKRVAGAGGFIRGWANHFEPDAAPGDCVKVEASFDEIDTAAKILEGDDANYELRGEFAAVLKRLQAEDKRMNDEEERHFQKPRAVIHRGSMFDRTVGDFAQARRERAFAELWEEENEKDILLARLLNMHLQIRRLSAPFRAERWPTQGQATDHATVIQWLGSHVGFAFVEEALRRAGYVINRKREAADDEEG